MYWAIIRPPDQDVVYWSIVNSEEEAKTLEKAISKREPGRPRKYEGRNRTTLMLSADLIEKIDHLRGKESRSVYIESVLRFHVETEQERKTYWFPNGKSV